MKKFFAVFFLIFSVATSVNAEIKTYSATSEEILSEFDSDEVIKLRARNKAVKIAENQAVVDFKNKFGEKLTDDEIFAIIVNSGTFETNFEFKKAEKTWIATLEFKIDDSEVQNFLRRDDRERFTLINQTLEQKKFFANNDLHIEKLRERAKDVKSREDKNFFKQEFDFVNNEFLSAEKVTSGNKFFYRGRIEDAINLYSEAITLNEHNIAAFNRRGNLYNVLAMNQRIIPMAETKRRQSLQDLDKATRLDNNYAESFSNRGFVYLNAKFFGQAIKDFDRAIKLEPNIAQNYLYRAQCYRQTDKNAALADFNKAVELNPKNFYVYSMRGNFFEQEIKDFSKAAEDYSRAIEFSRQESDSALNFYNRGGVYQKSGLYGKAIEDFSRAIEIFERSEQKNPILPWIYRKRGECYQSLGENSNSQADFKKFGDLQRR